MDNHDNTLEHIGSAINSLRGQRAEPAYWERLRMQWAELGCVIASAKTPDVENADDYPTLEEVRIDNFDDAMKVLK